jgi:hypothetical protein
LYTENLKKQFADHVQQLEDQEKKREEERKKPLPIPILVKKSF